MLNNKCHIWIIPIILLVCVLFSCSHLLHRKNIITLIENDKETLYSLDSPEELRDTFLDLLEQIKSYLDSDNGFRYKEEDDDYNTIMESFNLYNVTYISSLSRFKPEYNWNTGDKEQIAYVLAMMQIMEKRALTEPRTESE